MRLEAKRMGGEMLGPPSGKPVRRLQKTTKASWAFGVSAAFGGFSGPSQWIFPMSHEQ